MAPGLKNKKPAGSRLCFLACAASVILTANIRAEDVAKRQITTHPSLDFAPAVSPDGRWLAFVSERQGNLDLWVKRLPNETAVQVTFHQAEDTDPTWSPDGKRLYFVSKRRDALGDICFVSLRTSRDGKPKGNVIPLTQHLGKDGEPSISHDGKWLAFVSDRSGSENVWLMNLKTRATRQLTQSGGTDPCWSPKENHLVYTGYRMDPGGDLYFLNLDQDNGRVDDAKARPLTSGRWQDGQASWSPDGRFIVFVRHDRDTDHDGMITPMDNGSLWKLHLDPGENPEAEISYLGGEIQITTEIYSEEEPSWGFDRRIYFAQTRGDGLDIWSIPEYGLFEKLSDPLQQYQLALDWSLRAETEEALHEAVLGYQRVPDYFSSKNEWTAKALIQMADLYRILRQHDKAIATLDKAIALFPEDRGITATAQFKKAAVFDSVDLSIEQCRMVIESYPEQAVAAEAWLCLGDLIQKKGQPGESLSAYGRVINQYGHTHSLRAQAQLSIGDLFEAQGQFETARQSYLTVLREFSSVPLWRERAGDRLLGQIQGNTQQRIQKIQLLIQEVPDFPSLIAKAQLSIVRLLLESGELDLAQREIAVLDSNQSLDWAEAESRLLRAEIHLRMQEELEAILVLEQVIRDHGNTEGGVYRELAENRLFDALMASAERLQNQGDVALAESRYRRALVLRPGSIHLHRGLVESAFRAGHIQDLIREYDDRLAREPQNPVFLYAKGLALSFLGEHNQEFLDESNIYLLRSLEEDYSLIHPYRALSYNYERMERIQEEKAAEKSGFLKRAGRTIIAPLRWAYGLLPFVEERKPQAYYEKAIQALTTAMELNDEEQDRGMETLLAQNLANNFYNLGEFGYKRAFSHYQTRLALDTVFSQPLEAAVFYERAGRCGIVVDEPGKTTSYLKKSIHLFESLGREERVYQNKGVLAFLYHLAGDYESAISIYRETVIRDERNGNWDGAELGYRNIAYNYQLMQEPDQALVYAKKAEAILNRKRIPMKRSHAGTLRVEIFGLSIPVWRMEEIGGASSEGFSPSDEAALVYGLISRSQEAMKNYVEAILYQSKRLDLFQKRKDNMAMRIALNRMGALHYKKGEYDKAWFYFHWSWRECRKHKDIRGRVLNAINLGNVAAVSMHHLGSLEYFGEAETRLRKEWVRVGKDADDEQRLSLLTMMGTLFGLYGDAQPSGSNTGESLRNEMQRLRSWSDAVSLYSQAYGLADSLGLWRHKAVLLKNLAEMHLSLGNWEESLECFEECLKLAEDQRDESILWRAYYGLGRLFSMRPEELNRSSQRDPLAWYFKAIEILTLLPEEEESSEERLADRNERKDLYWDTAYEQVARGNAEEAMETLEKGRQKQIADIIARRPPQLNKERHKILWGNLRYLRSRLQENRIALSQAQNGSASAVQSLAQEQVRFQEEYRELLKTLYQEDEVLAYLAGSYPVDLFSLQELLPQDGIALTLTPGKNKTLLGVLERETVRFHVLPFPELELRSLTERFLRQVQKDSSAGLLPDRIAEVLNPLAEEMRGRPFVLLVPDGSFWLLPLHTLDPEAPQRNKTVVYAPSVSAYAMSHGRRRINQEKILFVGEEKPGGEYRIFGDDSKSTTFLTGEISKETFLKAASNSDVVHVQRWMSANDWNPLLSALSVSGGSDAIFYSAEEVFPSELKASVFILPPVRAAFTPNGDGERIFFYGLLYAGVPSLCLPFWEMPRPVSESLYRAFYQNLKVQSVSDALSTAQKDLRNLYPNTIHWAGSRIVGYQGMNDQDRVLFSQENLRSTLQMGFGFEQRGDFPGAVRLYEKARSMAAAVSDTLLVERIDGLMVRASYTGSIWDKAVEVQERIRRSAERTDRSETVLESLSNLSVFYINSRQYAKAADIKRQMIALKKEKEGENAAIQDMEELAFILAMGRAYGQAISVMDEIFAWHSQKNEDIEAAKSMIRRGRFYLEGEQYDAAYRDLSGAVQALLQIPENERPKPLEAELAAGLQLLGLACENMALYAEAENRQQEALNLFKGLRAEASIAQSLQNLANLYWKTGRYREALNHQNQALDSFRRLGNDRMLSVAHSTLGLIYLGLGDFQQARKAEEQALDLAEKAGSQEDQATILKNMGLVAIQEKDYARAFQSFRKASVLDSTLGFRRGLSYDRRNLGMLLLEQNQLSAGIDLIQEGLILSRGVGDGRNEVQCLYGLGEGAYRSGKAVLALAYLDSAVAKATEMRVPEILWRLHRLKGKIHSEAGRLERGLTELREAVSVVEAIRADLKVEAFQQGFIDDKMDLYTDIIALLMKMNRTKEAFQFVERAKSRSFIDLLGNQQLVLARGESRLLEQEVSARNAVQEAQGRLASLASGVKSEAAEQERGRWENLLEERRKNYESIVAAIQSESPELASFVQVDPWPVDKIQGMLPDSSLLVEYYATSSSLHIWTATREFVKYYEVAATARDLEDQIKRFREGIQALLSVDVEARNLYNWLVRPFENELKTASHLILIPHGALHYLPFGALRGDMGYLIERFSFSLAPSATVFGYCLEKGDDTVLSGQTLAFSNPDLGDPRYDLPFADKEVQSLQRTFERVTVVSGTEVTEERVRKSVRDKEFIHFACHGVYEAESPLFSALLLSSSGKDDGRLEVHEIFGLGLNSRLVMLSACETGLAHITRGDDVIGLSRGFLFAGTPAVITSLWKVDDLATAVLVKRFYRYLKAGDSRARAMQKAQRVVMEQVNRHPSAWAAFQITGDFR